MSLPARRFPEFRGTEGWKKFRLIDTADRSVKWSFIGGPFGSNLKSTDYAEDGVRIIQLQNIGDGEFFNDYRIFTTLEKADELRSNNIYPGEIIMSKMGDPVGRACLIPNLHDRYVMCSDGIRLVVDEKAHDKYFIYSLINSTIFRSTVENTATGSTRKRIGLEELKNLPMRLPAKAEQQKIADCLSSLDELIAAQARKVDAFKTHKKGLMQQLFPREGETQPRLRFPEFQDAEEWEDQSVGDFGKVVTGSTPSTAQPAFFGGSIPFVSPADISDLRFVDQTKTMLTSEGFSETRPIRPGSVLFVCIGSTIGKVAQNVRNCATNQQINAVVPSSMHSDDFVYFALSHASERIALLAGRQAVPIINKSLFSAVRLLVPKFAEQQRIADCLTSLDTLITAATQELETLKTHKKGLMQQLFPIVDNEVPA